MNTTTIGFEHRELDFEATVKFSGGRPQTYGQPAEEPEMEVVEVELVSTFSGENLPDWQEKSEVEGATAFLYEGDGVWDDMYKRAMDQLSAEHDDEDRR